MAQSLSDRDEWFIKEPGHRLACRQVMKLRDGLLLWIDGGTCQPSLSPFRSMLN